MKHPNLKIESIHLAEILPYPNNTKLHPEAQVAQIAGSIREFGFNDPIAIDEQGTIIEGHGRYLAAQLLKLKTVPIIRLNHLTPAQRKAYALAHNKLTLNSDFDFELLKVEFEALQEMDLGDLELTGFSEDEINDLMKSPDFNTSTEDQQGKLDKKTEVICPNCGHEFEVDLKH